MLETPIIINKEIDSVPKIAVGILVGVLLFGVFIVGFYQARVWVCSQAVTLLECS